MRKKFDRSFIINSLNTICECQRDLFDPYCDYTQGIYDGLMCIADDLGISYERGEITCRFFNREEES